MNLPAPDLSTPDSRFGRGYLAAGLALILLKLWLVAAQPIYAIAFANYDDALFLRLADFLRQGEWLGPYDQFTLAKGPMYPLFIAATYQLHLPLFTAQQLLYAAACVGLTAAIRPLLPNRALRFSLFVVLLFNPVTYDTLIHARVLRQDILYSLVLMVVAGFIGLHAQRGSARRMLPWALLTGAALPAFWLTREEGVWLLPCVLALWLAPVMAVGRDRSGPRGTRLACLALPGIMWAGGIAWVAGLNFRHYGIFTTCEFNHPAMKAAYGALTRVEPQRWESYVPVTREMRERLYPLSPAFAVLQPELEGPTGEAWAGITESLTHRPVKEREIASVWFVWALRRAVQDTGHAHNGAEAMDFFARMAREINEACDRGLIKAGPPRSGFLPPLHGEQWENLPSSLIQSVREIITFDHMATRPLGPSLGNAEDLALFARLSRGHLIPAGGPPGPPAQTTLDGLRTGILHCLYLAYHWTSPWLGGLALLAWSVAAGRRSWRNPRGFYFALAGIGLLGSVLTLAGIVALIDVAVFPSIETGYFSGAYALWLLFMFTGALALAETLHQTNQSGSIPPAA